MAKRNTNKSTKSTSVIPKYRQVLFLDIDGVLNSHQSEVMYMNLHDPIPSSWDQRPCPIALGNLVKILKDCPDVVIIISSAWRYWKNLKELKEMFTEWIGKEYAKRIKGTTPVTDIRIDGSEYRGSCIKKWIEKNGMPSKFIILDDNSDMEPYMDHLHKTCSLHGLQLGDAFIIVEYFTGKPYYNGPKTVI